MGHDPEAHDSAGVRVPPPVVFAAGFALGWLLGWVVGLPPLPRSAVPAGIAALLAGAVPVAWSALLFLRAGTPLEPHKPTTSIVTGGPYRLTRNPIYLGFALVHAGTALTLRLWGPLLALAAVVVVIDRFVIAREERFLERRFGAAYTAYRARVRRWL